ncbi:unnamed protein product [Ectocarpus sp. CCAP 1310/34]|nr:unnamed protein product [Ectocarpus sp. CCAP 1310/34]
MPWTEAACLVAALTLNTSAISFALLRVSSMTSVSMSLHGELFVYSPKKRLAAFRSGCHGGGSSSSDRQSRQQRHNRKHAVFVPGLTDGLLALDYVPELAAALDRLGFAFVQPVLSSSYQGYGTSSLRQDVEELDELLDYLSSTPSPPVPEVASSDAGSSSSSSFLLIGHSTGCQDAVFYMKHGRPDLRAAVVGVVLQAPVSDREYLETLPSTEGFIEEARVRGGGGELMPVAADQAPITAARFLSLATKVNAIATKVMRLLREPYLLRREVAAGGVALSFGKS